jgi:hypothetical protein
MLQNYYIQKQRAHAEGKQFDETVERIISAGPILAKEQYIQRHDTVCAEMHSNICKKIEEKIHNKQLYELVLTLV